AGAGRRGKAGRCGRVGAAVLELAAVVWVHRHLAVIGPEGIGAELRAGAGLEDALGRGHGAEGAPTLTPHVAEAREEAGAGRVEAERDVAGGVHREGALPAMVAIRRIGALLVDTPGPGAATRAGRGRGAPAQLLPPDARVVGEVAHVYRLVQHQGFVVEEVPVG